MKDRALKVMALGFSLWGLFLRYQALANREWWVDETNQFNCTKGIFKPVWLRLSNGEVTCFPGEYLLTYPFVAIFGSNKWGVAIPHIIATVLGFYVLYLICRKYLQTWWASAMAFLLFSMNSELIFHSFELRPYAVLAPFGLAVFYLTGRLFDTIDPLVGWQRCLAGMLFLGGIIYHAYGIFIVTFIFLFFFCREYASTSFPVILKRVGRFYILLAMVALPAWLWYASGQAGVALARNNTFDYISNPLVSFSHFSRSVLGALMGYKLLYPLLLGPILSFFLPHSLRWLQLGFFLVIVVMPIVLVCYMDAHSGYWFLQRQFIWVIALFGFFVAWCWEASVQYLISIFRKN